MSNQTLYGALIIFFVAAGQNIAWGDSHETADAFIEGEVALTPEPDWGGVSRYVKEGLDLNKYNRILIEPVEIWIPPDSRYKGIRPDDLKTLTDTFRQILVDELEPKYPVVSKAGPGTMLLRLAIAGVKLQKGKREVLAHTAIGYVVTFNLNALGKRVSLQNAGIEAELLDANSGERLGVLIDKEVGAKSEPLSWEVVEKALRFYAKRFRRSLDRTRGVAK